ncbi:Hypothetical_protein [Hexamita inflata]|uniref:Hypothetical_protein n=1 Tax=Hexamita inflata TaxID=28002 RepID=A0AA86U8W3_9EUKA|nr:Hypothetical protein HINF_LOCUS29612 [Hexamita inflata]
MLLRGDSVGRCTHPDNKRAVQNMQTLAVKALEVTFQQFASFCCPGIFNHQTRTLKDHSTTFQSCRRQSRHRFEPRKPKSTFKNPKTGVKWCITGRLPLNRQLVVKKMNLSEKAASTFYLSAQKAVEIALHHSKRSVACFKSHGYVTHDIQLQCNFL